ncbi:MAG: hypothetical protein U1F11_07410 [Steroidobacteraceae bacterium]
MDDVKAVRAAIEYSTEPRIAFFDDPSVDKVLGITMAVAQEVGQVLERLDTLERLLVRSGALREGAVQAFVPDGAVAQQRLAMQEAFVARLLRVIEQEVVALRAAQGAAGPAAARAGGTG